MTGAGLLERAAAEGVTIALATPNRLKITGNRAVVEKWLPILRERKGALVEVLSESPGRAPIEATAFEPGKAATQRAAALDAAELKHLVNAVGRSQGFSNDELAVTLALALADVVPALHTYRVQAAEIPAVAGSMPDNRRTCDQCVRLIRGRCMAAANGEIAAAREYTPTPTIPRRCEGYEPDDQDPDQRSAAARWALATTEIQTSSG
jgi:hypothetical protein